MFFEAKNICKNFGGLRALNKICLGIARGEILALIGPNGAGKTTFFNIVSGIYPPDEGIITFNGRNIIGLRPHHITALGIARTFQNLRLFPQMNVLENILSGFYLHARYGVLDVILKTKRFKEQEEKILRAAYSLVRFIGLENKENLLAKNLSYGEQKKLELARALATKPLLLLLDEPTAGMNPKETEEMMSLIKKIQQENVSILLIEHDMKVVMNISDRIIVLDYGEKIAEGKPDDIKNDKRVIEAYLGKKGNN